ncbi:MAG TPA: hypothetical protein VFU88_02765 [Ktedonobacterales bacterium]|nr:hypothetical protein [Ktedonobacterales bacterium]
MAIAEAVAEPAWLHTAGQIAGVLLLLELGLVLIIVAALMVGMAFGARWLHLHVVPVLREYTPKAQQAMTVARTSTDKAVTGIAEFYGWRQRITTTVRVLLFGRGAAKRVYEEAAIQASSELKIMDSSAEVTGPDTGFAPRWQSGAQAAEARGHSGETGTAAAPEVQPEREHRPEQPDQFNTLAGNAG